MELPTIRFIQVDNDFDYPDNTYPHGRNDTNSLPFNTVTGLKSSVTRQYKQELEKVNQCANVFIFTCNDGYRAEVEIYNND